MAIAELNRHNLPSSSTFAPPHDPEPAAQGPCDAKQACAACMAGARSRRPARCSAKNWEGLPALWLYSSGAHPRGGRQW